MENKISDRKKILDELIHRQIPNIQSDKKLRYSDMIRIGKYIDTSIFDENCCLWNGYITNFKNITKGTYINFFFRNKKVALHRLLYNNFIEVLSDDEYLKFSCENRGKCCNIHHMIKYKYNHNVNNDKNESATCVEISNDKKSKKNKKSTKIGSSNNSDSIENFTITFD